MSSSVADVQSDFAFSDLQFFLGMLLLSASYTNVTSPYFYCNKRVPGRQVPYGSTVYLQWEQDFMQPYKTTCYMVPRDCDGRRWQFTTATITRFRKQHPNVSWYLL